MFLLEINTTNIDVTGNEAILNNKLCVGYVTSGGYAHYSKKSLAFGFINKNLIKNDRALEVEINGIFYKAVIINDPIYDKNGSKMKS